MSLALIGSLARRAFVIAAAAALASLPATRAGAEIVTSFEVGSGSSSSIVQIDFSNGNGYLLTYRYDGEATGFDALLAFEVWLPEFTLVHEDTAFGPLVTGLGVVDDYEYGNGDQWPVVENYWHYWLADGGAWDFALEGASGRRLFDGSLDGWVFGSPVPPQPIPGPPALLLPAASAFAMDRRRRD